MALDGKYAVDIQAGMHVAAALVLGTDTVIDHKLYWPSLATEVEVPLPRNGEVS
jgi:hypothetical protein